MSKRMQAEGARNASPKIPEAARLNAAREETGKLAIGAIANEFGADKSETPFSLPTKKALRSGLLDLMLAAHREFTGKTWEQYPARNSHGHMETVMQPKDAIDDLSMTIPAATVSDFRLSDLLRTEPNGDPARILTDTQDILMP